MNLGPLKLVFYEDDLDLEAGTLQVFPDRLDMPGPLPVEAQQWEDDKKVQASREA